MFLFKLILFLFFLWALRLMWRLGWSIYWWRKQLQNVSQQQPPGNGQGWRFVFTRGPRGGFYRASSSSSSAEAQDEAADRASTTSSSSSYPPGGEVIDAQFRVLSEKDDD